MLLQALTDYAHRYLAEELKDAAWTMKRVHWQIKISLQGDFLGVVDRTAVAATVERKNQDFLLMSIARSPVNRSNGEHPLLGTDEISYVLGVGPWTGNKFVDRSRAQKHHAAFVNLVGRAALDTGEPALASCARFYAKLEEVEKARDAVRKARAGALVAFDIDGPLVERESVREYWRKLYSDVLAARTDGVRGECMVSGKSGPIASPHPRIQGLSNLGGQASGVALVSFEHEAFCSYGWRQNQNCPVSPDRAFAYVLALNDLLKHENGRRKDIAGHAFLYWLTNTSKLDLLGLLDGADPKEVRALLSYDPRKDCDPNRFCMVAVSGNGGRMRLNYWVEIGLSEVKSNLQDWFSQLRLEYPKLGRYEPRPVQLWQLLRALDRNGEPDHPVVLALLRRSIEGLPLGYAVLSQALRQLRRFATGDPKATSADKKAYPMSLGRLRASLGLIRLCMNDLLRQKGEVPCISEGLNQACTLPAYVWGRLMAEYEYLQLVSSTIEYSSSIVNRYFALASDHPALAFPKIEILAQRHLRILHRNSRTTAELMDVRLQNLRRLLTFLDSTASSGVLSLEEQGFFALGYYHQKARWRTEEPRERRDKAAGSVFRDEPRHQEFR